MLIFDNRRRCSGVHLIGVTPTEPGHDRTLLVFHHDRFIFRQMIITDEMQGPMRCKMLNVSFK